MIHYVVVVGDPRIVARHAPTLEATLRSSSSLDVPATTTVAPDGRWAVAALSATDALSSDRLATDGDRFAIVNGPALVNNGDQRHLASDVLRWIDRGGADLATRHMGGSYNLVALDSAGVTIALPDFSGISPLYWSQQADHVVISNRSTAVRDTAGATGWDARALSWLIGHASLFADELPASGARYLRPGEQLRIEARASAALVAPAPRWVWPAPDDPPDLANLTDGEWDAVTADLVENCLALSTVGSDPTVYLSGGKDSRLALALMLAAGLGDRIRAVSTGNRRHPDAVCAAEVAKVAGVGHICTGEGSDHRQEAMVTAFEAGQVDLEGDEPHWAWLRRAAFRYEGIVCLWNGAGPQTRSEAIAIKGHGGELFRGPTRHAKPLAGIESPTVDQVAQAFVSYQQPIDPLGVLAPDIREFQTQWLRSWVYETAETVRLDLLPEKFYVDYWLGHWNGPLGQGQPLQPVVNPVLSATVAETVLQLGPRAREDERFHYEVMRRAAPELLSVPFVKQRWSDTILAEDRTGLPATAFRPGRPGRRALRLDGPPPLRGIGRWTRRWRRRTRKAVRAVTAGESLRRGSRRQGRDPGVPVTPPSTKGNRALRWQWSFLESQSDEIQALFGRAQRDTDMAEICDLDRLRSVAARASDIEENVDGKAIISAVSVALTLLDEGAPFTEGDPG